MPSPKIEVREVWKKFHRGELHDSLRDLVPDLARRLVGRAPRRDELAQDDFWALKDISFDMTPGQAMGIIGPNGASVSGPPAFFSPTAAPLRSHSPSMPPQPARRGRLPFRRTPATT